MPDILPAYKAEAGALADALMRQGMYSVLATKIETAWQAVWRRFAGTKIISEASSSNSSSSNSVGSQIPGADFDLNHPIDLSGDDLPSDWIDQLPTPTNFLFSLDSAQGQAMLEAFRQQLRLTVDQVGENILDLPTATTEAAKIYAELLFRQLYMLKQFIDPDQPK